MNIEILKVRFLKGDKATRGFADVLIGDITIKDFRIFHADGGPAHVEVPMVTWRDPQTRELRFKPVVTLPGELMGRVQAEILSCYYRVMEENKSDQKDQ